MVSIDLLHIMQYIPIPVVRTALDWRGVKTVTAMSCTEIMPPVYRGWIGTRLRIKTVTDEYSARCLFYLFFYIESSPEKQN